MMKNNSELSYISKDIVLLIPLRVIYFSIRKLRNTKKFLKLNWKNKLKSLDVSIR